MVSSTEERRWRQQFETQRYVQVKKEDGDMNSRCKISSSEEGRRRHQFELQRQVKPRKEGQYIRSRKGTINWRKKMKTSIGYTKVCPTEERRLRHKF